MDDTTFLPFTPTFSSTYSVIINKPLSEVFQKFGTGDAHVDVCALRAAPGSTLTISVGDKDLVFLAPGETIQETSFIWKPKAPDTAGAADTCAVAHRQHFQNSETAASGLFNLLKSSVKMRETLTWVDPSPERLAQGPIFSVYESVSVDGPETSIYRLRKMEAAHVGEGQAEATKLTEYLHGVSPWYKSGSGGAKTIAKHR